MGMPLGTTETAADSTLAIEPRSAQISAYQGHKIAVCLVLSVSDLRCLGIDIESTEQIAYRIDRPAGVPRLVITESQPSTGD